MNYQDAIAVLKSGKKIARAAWNGKIWLSYYPGTDAHPAANFWSQHNREFAEQRGGFAEVLPCITMKNSKDKILMGWRAGRDDMRATDWEEIA